jgi:DNA-binding GntR family transcriptional regulator
MQHPGKRSVKPVAEPPLQGSPLQRELAARVVELLREQRLPAGSTVTEIGFAQQLGVSRSPVRAAFGLLRERGVLSKDDGTWRLTRDSRLLPELDPEVPVADSDRLFVAIARDRLSGALPADISEADLTRRYEVTRPTVLKVLARLAELGQVERKRGHGWSFVPSTFDAQTRAESYRFRLTIEPAALLEPDFRLDPGWLAEMRRRHEAMLKEPWHETTAVALFDLNAEFHEGLAAASGNRFFRMAVVQQNRLRRFVNVNWKHGPERVRTSCLEHLEILARLEAGQRDVAAALMRSHLQAASELGRQSTTEAAPAARRRA